MFDSLHSERLSTIRDEARSLARRTGDHEGDLQALVVAAELHVQHAEEALAGALVPQGRLDRFQALLCTQLQRSHESAETARQLWTRAREQHAAANLLLSHLEPASSAAGADQPADQGAVLVVDDYEQVREFVAEVLKRAGFVVRTAANGLEGLLAAYEMRPAVIVMDIAMPVLDGIEATRLIKVSEATRRARVIAYTGNATLDDSMVAELFAAVVHKPASPAVIVATVQQLANQ